MNIEVANRLVMLRKQSGLSQEELAEKLGLSRQAVSKWERAESSPDIDNLIRLSRLYNITLDTLLRTSIELPDPEPEPKVHKEPYSEPPAAPDIPESSGAWEIFDTVPIDSDENKFLSIIHSLSGAYPIIVVILFLATGFLFRLWHPMWMLFLTIPLYYTLPWDKIYKIYKEHRDRRDK